MTEVVADSIQFLEPRNRSEQPNSSSQENAPASQRGYQANNSYTNQGQANTRQGSNHRASEEPFQNGAPVEVTDDDLPF